MRELNIDWAALHSAFQMAVPEVKCFLSLENGTVVKLPPGDVQLAQVRSTPTSFLEVGAVPSRIQYQWVDEFAKTVEDETLRSRIEVAINGKGAFRRFKDILLTYPDERRRWFEFRDQKMREYIVEWVREGGVAPLNDPPWLLPPEVPGAEAAAAPARAPSLNSPQDVEALRDFLIEWAEGKDAGALQPMVLEELATTIATRFKLKLR